MLLVTVSDNPVIPSGVCVCLCSLSFPGTAGRVGDSTQAAATKQRCAGMYFTQWFVPQPRGHMSAKNAFVQGRFAPLRMLTAFHLILLFLCAQVSGLAIHTSFWAAENFVELI